MSIIFNFLISLGEEIFLFFEALKGFDHVDAFVGAMTTIAFLLMVAIAVITIAINLILKVGIELYYRRKFGKFNYRR